MRRVSWAIVAASLSVHSVAGSHSASPTQSPAPLAIVELIERIDRSLVHSSYSHVTRVSEREGRYEFDCSGMAAWVLRKTAPRAQASVASRRGRPLARDYYQRIAATRPGRTLWGWQRVSQVSEALPGDVIAWLKPSEIRSPNTGHVAFVVEPARALEGFEHAYLLRIADASSYQHQDDSRADSGRTGFGFGTILVVADPESGEPAAYGWFGRYSRWVLQAKMAIGRPLR